jgi:protein TonB
MLAYSASRPRISERSSSPNAMLVIIGAHVALVAAVMSAKMDLPAAISRTPTIVEFIPEPVPPEPRVTPRVPQEPRQSVLDNPDPKIDFPAPVPIPIEPMPPLPDPGASVGPSPTPRPAIEPTPLPKPQGTAARLLTGAEDLRPPYPEAKRLRGEEALLTLRLTIDERGRVVAVEPVGPADRAFVDAARRHLLARWRYKPATEAGRAIASTLTIKLRFQLES